MLISSKNSVVKLKGYDNASYKTKLFRWSFCAAIILSSFNLQAQSSLIKVTDFSSEDNKSLDVINPKQAVISSLRFSPDGKLILMENMGSFSVWDWKNKKKIGELGTIEGKIRGDLFTASITPSGEVITGGTDGNINVYEADTLKLKKSFYVMSPVFRSLNMKALITKIWISPQGSKVIVQCNDTAVNETTKIYDWQTEKQLWGSGESLNNVIVSPDEKYMFSGNGDKITIWDFASGKKLKEITPVGTDPKELSKGNELDEDSKLGFVFDLGVSSDSETILLIAEKKCLKLNINTLDEVSLEKVPGNNKISKVLRSSDQKKFIVEVQNPKQGNNYYELDVDTNKLVKITNKFNDLDLDKAAFSVGENVIAFVDKGHARFVFVKKE